MVEVAPETLFQVDPPSVESCHWTVGVGVPVAPALKEAGDPAVTVTELGCWVTVGAAPEAALTVKVAASVVADPDRFLKTARYSVPLCATVVEGIE